MDLTDELRVLLARMHALEVQSIAMFDRLGEVEKRIETDEKRIASLEQSTDSGRDRLPQ